MVCKSGLYVMKVLDRKVSYDRTYIILHNTMNGFLRPALARLVGKYEDCIPIKAVEPLFTEPDAFQFHALPDNRPEESVTLAGNLCTSADLIAEDIILPRLKRGECVVVTNAGSYAAVLSPMQFSSQQRPAELFLKENGEIVTFCVL